MVQDAATAAQKIGDLEQRLARNPEGLLFLPLAEAYRKAGRLPQAQELLRRGLERHPDHHAARVALGRVLAQSGQSQEAVGELLAVLEVVPDNLLAARLLGELEAEAAASSGSTDSAGDPVAPPRPTEAVAVPPTEPAEVFEEHETPAAAPESLDERIAADGKEPSPADELSSLTLGDLYLRQGDHQAARQIYREVLEREPGNREVVEKIAHLESRLADAGRGEASRVDETASVNREPDRRIVALGRFLEAARRLRNPRA